MYCFIYYNLVWLFYSKFATQRIDSTQARALRAINMDFYTPRENLLEVYDGIPVHISNLRLLLIEVFKSMHGLNREFMWGLFVLKNMGIALRHGTPLALPAKGEGGTNSIVIRAILAWNNLPAELKQSHSLSEFMSGISKMVKFYCHCKTCS